MKFISTTFLLFAFVKLGCSQNYIIVGDAALNNIQKFDLDGNFIEMIDPDINTPREIEIDYEQGLVFYTNGTDDSSIRVYDMNTNEGEYLISDLISPSRLAGSRGTSHLLLRKDCK